MNANLCHSVKGIALIAVVALAASCEGRGPGSSSTPATSTQNQMKGHDEAARKALEALPTLVTAETFSGMGFGSVEEARSAKLGEPTPLRTVSYNKLLEYQPGGTLEQLLEPAQQFVYPVMVGGAVKTSIVVAQQADGWRIGSVGDRHFATILEESRNAPSAAPPVTAPNATPGGPTPNVTPGANTPNATPTPAPDRATRKVDLISIPGINVELISFSEGDQRMLQPTEDLPEAKLTKGRAIREQDALSALANYAKEFDRKYGEEIRKRHLVK